MVGNSITPLASTHAQRLVEQVLQVLQVLQEREQQGLLRVQLVQLLVRELLLGQQEQLEQEVST